jgi:L-asparagine oxygenase
MPRLAGKPVVECAEFRGELRALCARLRADSDRERAAFLRQAALASDSLPHKLRLALHDFRLHGNRDGYLLLRGMPASTGRSGVACLALVGSRLGEFVGYAQEKNGALFHDVVPEKTQEHEQSAASSRARLKLHTERCFHPYLPSHVLLACLRPDRGGEALTEIASVRRMLPLLPARHLPVLFKPVFRTGIDYSFGNVRTRKANGPVVSILYGNDADPYLRYDLDLMAGLNARARAALDAVKLAALAACTPIGLETGDLLIIDNRRAAHGRSAFTPAYDGPDRWLKRAYLVESPPIAAADYDRRKRVVRTRFGSGARAGARRRVPK